MYGMVNKAIAEMVCQQFGEDTWQQIKRKAELNVDVFLSMDAYPDDLTHRLVKAASAVLGLSASDVMQAFGEYWVKYTAEEGYGDLLEMSGDTLPEFLENLDNMHARVGVSFPQLKPPAFECTHMTEDSLNLHYQSTREGLTPMVIGLVKGLGERFNTEVTVSQIQNREYGADHDEFVVKYKQH